MAQIDYVRVVDEDGIEQSIPVRRFEVQKDLFKRVDFLADDAGRPFAAFGPADVPTKNAPADEWREFTRTHAGSRGLSSEQVELMNRDEMVAAFTSAAPPAKAAASGTATTSEES